MFLDEAEKEFLLNYPDAERNSRQRLEASNGNELCVDCGFIGNPKTGKKYRFIKGNLNSLKSAIKESLS